MKESLNKIFYPKTVALIGASNRPATVGNALMKNLLAAGFEGIIYPVNLKNKSISGVRAYSSIGEIPDKIDLAIICTPSHTVSGVIRECGEAGVGGLLVISAGFKEMGEKAKDRTAEIVRLARHYGMRMVGPNCLGLINPRLKLNASFSQRSAQPGKIAFISQSGALCTAILDWAEEQKVGFSHFVSAGSMLDVGFHDLIDFFGNDPKTSSILIYMESLTHAREFMSAARAFSRSKPIIVLKAGKSEEGSLVAKSHTGNLAGNDLAFDAAFRRAGILRVDTISQLFNCAQALAMQRRPSGNRLAIVTNAGGPGVLATDHLIQLGGKLAQFSATTFGKLNDLLPEAWSHGDPVDILGDASPERYRESIKLCIQDPNVDALLVMLTPQAVTRAETIAAELVKLSKISSKTILAVWMGEKDVQVARDMLEAGSIPTYRYPESAVDVFMAMYRFDQNQKLLYETPASIPGNFSPKTSDARAVIEKVKSEGRTSFTEFEAKQLLSAYDLPVLEPKIAQSAEEAAYFAAETGFPVVMKIVSADILHKTDVRGVRLNVSSKEEAKVIYESLISTAKKERPDAFLQGVLIERMEKKRYELLIGSKKDPVFGPLIAFGMGGIAVELYKDLNVGLPPLNMELAHQLIKRTKVYTLLEGYRGMKGVDIDAIQFMLYKFAYLVMDFPEINEIEINPLVVDEHGAVVLDARVTLDEKLFGKKIKPYAHLSISPYPKEYIREFQMKNGEKVLFRPIRPEDEPLEAEMLARTSNQSQHFRFFGPMPKVTHEMLVRYTQIDYDREIAIMAQVKEDGQPKMAAVVRLVMDTLTNQGEYAILVADPWQALGLGSLLTAYILEIAQKRGVSKVYASVLNSNERMLQLFRKNGFSIKRVDLETSYVEKEIMKLADEQISK